MSSTTGNVNAISYSTDVVVGKQTQEMCICNWDGVWSIQAHTRTNIQYIHPAAISDEPWVR